MEDQLLRYLGKATLELNNSDEIELPEELLSSLELGDELVIDIEIIEDQRCLVVSRKSK